MSFSLFLFFFSLLCAPIRSSLNYSALTINAFFFQRQPCETINILQFRQTSFCRLLNRKVFFLLLWLTYWPVMIIWIEFRRKERSKRRKKKINSYGSSFLIIYFRTFSKSSSEICFFHSTFQRKQLRIRVSIELCDGKKPTSLFAKKKYRNETNVHKKLVFHCFNKNSFAIYCGWKQSKIDLFNSVQQLMSIKSNHFSIWSNFSLFFFLLPVIITLSLFPSYCMTFYRVCIFSGP